MTRASQGRVMRRGAGFVGGAQARQCTTLALQIVVGEGGRHFICVGMALTPNAEPFAFVGVTPENARVFARQLEDHAKDAEAADEAVARDVFAVSASVRRSRGGVK